MEWRSVVLSSDRALTTIGFVCKIAWLLYGQPFIQEVIVFQILNYTNFIYIHLLQIMINNSCENGFIWTLLTELVKKNIEPVLFIPLKCILMPCVQIHIKCHCNDNAGGSVCIGMCGMNNTVVYDCEWGRHKNITHREANCHRQVCIAKLHMRM